MANQRNYQERVRSLINQRPYRPSARDQANLLTAERYALFGIHPNDNVELWIYNAQGEVVNSIRLSADSPKLKVLTVVTSRGNSEYISLNLDEIARELDLSPGRYSFVANFFRDEVGSLLGDKLVIEEISPSRTEVRLRPATRSSSLRHEIHQFVVPSVPRLKAQALMDQVFARDLESGRQTELTNRSIKNALDRLIQNTSNRLNTSGATPKLYEFLDELRTRVYNRSLELLREDRLNFQVNEEEFLSYVETALDEVLELMIKQKLLDPRMEIVT